MPITVTADDFGISLETSKGIIDAHLAGAVDRTSVMVACGNDRLERALPLLSAAPTLKLGLHLTLTSKTSRPLAATRASGLVASDGHFYSLPQLLLRTLAHRVSAAAIDEEIQAQLARYIALIGRPPTHLDGHHHSHQLPIVRDVVSTLIRSNILPKSVRCTVEPSSLRVVKGAHIRRSIIGWLGTQARPLFSSAGATLTDGFFGILSEPMLRDENPWSQYLSHIPSAGTYELGVHPGREDPDLIGRDEYLPGRLAEWRAMKNLGASIKSPRP